MMGELKPYLNEAFHRTFKNSANYSCVKGIDWINAYWDEEDENRLKFRRVPAEQVFPIWKDIEQTELDGLIHCFKIRDFTTEGIKEINHYHYYHREFVARYVQNPDNGTFIPYNLSQGYRPFVEPFFTVDAESIDLNEIDSLNPVGNPWICVRYDDEFTPVLFRIKDIIDEIDLARSEVADHITDNPNSLIVVKNYDGQDAGEFMANVNQHRTMFVSGDGDASSLEIPLDITGVLNYINVLNSTMYEIANGIDSSSKDTRDTSGVALSQLYRDLATEVKEWEIELRMSFRRCIDFMLYDIYMRDTSKDYRDIEYSVEFVYDIIVNETEQIQNALTSKGLISDETIIDNHPWAPDTAYEIKQMREEKEAELDMELDYEREAESFGTDTSTETSSSTEVIVTDNLDGVRGSANNG